MIYKLIIAMNGEAEEYYCATMDAVREIVFNIFTDWDINTDEIDEIDDRLREACEGSITITEHELYT